MVLNLLVIPKSFFFLWNLVQDSVAVLLPQYLKPAQAGLKKIQNTKILLFYFWDISIAGQAASGHSTFRHEQRGADRGERKPDRDQDPRTHPQLHQADPGQKHSSQESRLHQTFGDCNEIRLKEKKFCLWNKWTLLNILG